MGPSNSFGEVVRNKRLALELSVEFVAGRTGIKTSQLEELEAANLQLPHHIELALCALLDLTDSDVGRFFGHTDEDLEIVFDRVGQRQRLA